MELTEPEENSTSHSTFNEASFVSRTSATIYKECLKNHAAALGGNATDGCREFMPSDGGADEPLMCSACGCHRNFHRKEVEGRLLSSSSYSFEHFHQPPLHLHGVVMPRPFSMAPPMPLPQSWQPEAVKKRIRTKFTAEQKGKMLGYAEKVGWRMQRQDVDGGLQKFCEETGVKRRVLKVWMHNNKHKHFTHKTPSIAELE